MAALAVMAAILAAMFVAIGTTSAAALGDCSATDTNYLAIGDTCEIPAAGLGNADIVSHASEADKAVALLSGGGAYGTADATPPANTDPAKFTADGAAITVTALALGTITITDTNDTAVTNADATDDVTYKIEVIPAPSLEVIFDDSDGTVKAGTEVQVGIRIKAVGDNTAAVAVTLKAPSGLYFLDTGGDTDATNDTTPLIAPLSVNGGSSMTQGYAARKLQTAGARDDEYVVTATLAADVGNLKKGDYTATLTIGDPGAGLDSVELALDTGQKDTNAIATKVNLVATAKNAGGANANAGDVTSILVSATGGTIRFSTCPATVTTDPANFAQLVESTTEATLGFADTNCDGSVAAPADPNSPLPTEDMGLGAVTKFSVARATAGTVTVQVTIIGGAAGTKTSNELVLTFAGGADAIAVGDASDNLAQKSGKITFEVTATDKGGRTAAVSATAITVALKDADGATPKNLTVSDTQKFTDTDNDGEKDATEKDVDTAVIVTVMSDANNAAAAGHYTVEVTLNNNAKTKQTASFTVVGGAANIAVETDSSMVSLGDIITVTATVTDADGNTITNPPKTGDGSKNVHFASAGALKLAGFGANNDGVVMKASKDGVAEAKFVVTNGSGTAVILVDSGTATGTATVSLAGDAPPPVEADPALASISIEVVGEDHSAGSITVLASLADADGDAVEGMVSFYHSGDATLFGPKDVVTSDGTATAVYNASDDFTVLAVSGSHRASVSIAVTSAAEQAAADQAEADRIAQEEADAQAERDRIAAEEAAAEAEAERMAAEAEAERIAATVTAEIDRLSGMSGFTSWLAEGSTTASELFAALSADGATALHVWNGTAWVRYSVVDGTTVPGSVDFDIERGDVLFISN